jgi:hypothetical protein
MANGAFHGPNRLCPQDLPSGVGTPFSDTSGLSAETLRAITQLAQLGLTAGTGSGLFTPNASVPRWQMALFLVRLLARAGLSIPNGTDQGFIDLGGLPVEAITAINQAKQLGTGA